MATANHGHEPDRNHRTIYRYYSATTRELLYVGRTGNPSQRQGQHWADKHWWKRVGCVVYEHLPEDITDDEFNSAERRAIGRGWPSQNVQHNPQGKKWVREQYPSPTDEKYFSAEVAHRIMLHQPSLYGPYPIPYADFKRSIRGEVDQYPSLPHPQQVPTATHRWARDDRQRIITLITTLAALAVLTMFTLIALLAL